MAFELIYTSVPKGIKLGSSGFCTVAYTNGLAANYINQLERMSAYKPYFPHYDEHAAENPVAYSHYIISTSGMTAHILSRVCFYGLDYTKRSNKLAHHIVLSGTEAMAAAGPAAISLNNNLFRSEWNEEPQLFSQQKLITPPAVRSHVASCWAEYTGDAGWAGKLAQSFIDAPSKPVFIIYDPLKHKNILNLVEEALQLLPVDKRWQVSYNTYFYSVPAGVQCNWRFCVADPDVLREARRIAGTLIIDLTKELPPAGNGKLENSARSGVVDVPKAISNISGPSARKAPGQFVFPGKNGDMANVSADILNEKLAAGMSGRYGERQNSLPNVPQYPAASSSSGSFKFILSGIVFVAVLLIAGVFLFGKTIMQKCGVLPADTLAKQEIFKGQKAGGEDKLKNKKSSDNLLVGNSADDAVIFQQAQAQKQKMDKAKEASQSPKKTVAEAKKDVKKADEKKNTVQVTAKKTAPEKSKKPAPAVPREDTALIENNQKSFWLHYSAFSPNGKLSNLGNTIEFHDMLLKGETVTEVYVYSALEKNEVVCERNGDSFRVKEDTTSLGFDSASATQHTVRANYVIKCNDGILSITNKNEEAKAVNYPITKIVLSKGTKLCCNFIPGESRWPNDVANEDKLIIQLPGAKAPFVTYRASKTVNVFYDAWDKKNGAVSLCFKMKNKIFVDEVKKRGAKKYEFKEAFLPESIKDEYFLVREAERLISQLKDKLHIIKDTSKIVKRMKGISTDITNKNKEVEDAKAAVETAKAEEKSAKEKDLDAKREQLKAKENDLKAKREQLKALETEYDNWEKEPKLLSFIKLSDLQYCITDVELKKYPRLGVAPNKKTTFFDVNKDKKVSEVVNLALDTLRKKLRKEKAALEKIQVELYYKYEGKQVLLHKQVRFEVRDGK